MSWLAKVYRMLLGIAEKLFKQLKEAEKPSVWNHKAVLLKIVIVITTISFSVGKHVLAAIIADIFLRASGHQPPV